MSSVVSKPGHHLGHIDYIKIQINIATVRPKRKDKMTRNIKKYI